MPEFCTCGAQLPPDARFCHKCGKPQFDEPVEEAEAPAVLTPPPAPLTPPKLEISFHNVAAVRVALLAAALASLLISIPMPVFLTAGWMLVWLLSAGFLSVYLYRRRTGQQLSVRGGARMGWITGVFCFAIATVFFTISVVIISGRGGLASFYREQFSARGAPEAGVEQFLEVLQSPTGLGVVLLLSLVFLFLLFTLLPTVGGALGAKVLEKD